MSPAIRTNPKIPVGRPAFSSGTLGRPGEPPYRGEPPGLKPSEVRLLLFLGIGGAVCLLALALIGFAFNKRSDRGSQLVVAKVSKAVVQEPAVEHPAPEFVHPVVPVEPPVPVAPPVAGPKAVVPVAFPPEADLEPEEVAKAQEQAKKCVKCREFGTSIEFLENPPDAFKKARAFGKQVFMVHLSGNFEDKEFT